MGGTGRYPYPGGFHVLNLNLQSISDYPDFQDKPIPNFIYGDAAKLPFPSGSVEFMWAESMSITEAWAKEMIRVMKPGGVIKLYNPPGRIEGILKLFTDVNPNIKTEMVGDYLKGLKFRTGGTYAGGGIGAYVKLPAAP